MNPERTQEVREKTQALAEYAQQHPGEFRDFLAGLENDQQAFKIFSNVITYNWITGNEASGWLGKSFDWYPIADHPSEGRVHHFLDWYRRLQANPLNMLLAARKHTKTTFVCSLMMYRSEFMDGHASLYWANTQEQVKERMEELDEMIEANPWLSNLHTDSALLRKEFENGSRIRTTWVQGAAEGGHVDTSLGDDPMKEFADIPDSRIEEWYGKVIVPMLNPDGLHAIVGTRKRPNDLYELLRTKHEEDGALADLPSYTLTEYPAIREAWMGEYDRPGDLAPEQCYTEVDAPALASALGLDTDTLHILWPEARSAEWLAKNLGGQGKSYFLREFCMIFKQAEDAIVHREWITRTGAERPTPSSLDAGWEPLDYGGEVTRSMFDHVVVGHDPAGSGRDRFGFVTVGALTHPPGMLPPEFKQLALNEDGEPEPVQLYHILDVWQAQDVPPSRWRDKLTSLHDRYSPDAIAIESNLNATWTSDDDEIPRRVRESIEPIATTRRKHSWKNGVPSIGSDIEAGRYRFYTGGGDDNMTDDLITALTSVQMHEGELVGHTPDLVMALYMCHKWLHDKRGYIASSRRSLKGGNSEKDREREEAAREKKKALRESAVGRAILDNNNF